MDFFFKIQLRSPRNNFMLMLHDLSYSVLWALAPSTSTKQGFGNLFYAAQSVNLLPTTAASQAIKLCKEVQGVHTLVI
jgi:hypothetical protein